MDDDAPPLLRVLRAGGLDAAQAHLRVPAGTLRSSWARHSSTRVEARFSVPVGSAPAILGVPTGNISSPIVTESGTTVFKSGKLAESAAAKIGLVAARYVTAGSSVSLEFTTTGSGAWAFEVSGSAPTAAAPVSAKAGTKASLRCPAGSRITNIPQLTYGADGCSSGGAQFLVEQLCLLKKACEVDVSDAEFDPTDYTCRGVLAAERVLTATVECAAP